MRKLIWFAVLALLFFVSPAFASVAIDDIDGYVGEATRLDIEGQEVENDGSTVTILANGHKEGVTTNVSTESNLTSAALAYGVVKLVIGSTRYVSLDNGTAGQMITFIVTTAGGGTVYITDDKVADADTKTGWDDIALTELNDSVTLLYVDDTYGWIIVGQVGATIT
jgi:hypothetical protein